MKIPESFAIFMTGLFINYLIPIRAGEIAKSVILKLKKNVRISQSLPTIFIDKITDLFPIVLIMILVPIVSVRLNNTLKIIIIILFLIFLALLSFLFFAINHQQKALKFLHSFLKILPYKIRSRFEDFFSNFVSLFNGQLTSRDFELLTMFENHHLVYLGFHVILLFL